MRFVCSMLAFVRSLFSFTERTKKEIPGAVFHPPIVVYACAVSFGAPTLGAFIFMSYHHPPQSKQQPKGQHWPTFRIHVFVLAMPLPVDAIIAFVVVSGVVFVVIVIIDDNESTVDNVKNIQKYSRARNSRPASNMFDFCNSCAGEWALDRVMVSIALLR